MPSGQVGGEESGGCKCLEVSGLRVLRELVTSIDAMCSWGLGRNGKFLGVLIRIGRPANKLLCAQNEDGALLQEDDRDGTYLSHSPPFFRDIPTSNRDQLSDANDSAPLVGLLNTGVGALSVSSTVSEYAGVQKSSVTAPISPMRSSIGGDSSYANSMSSAHNYFGSGQHQGHIQQFQPHSPMTPAFQALTKPAIDRNQSLGGDSLLTDQSATAGNDSYTSTPVVHGQSFVPNSRGTAADTRPLSAMSMSTVGNQFDRSSFVPSSMHSDMGHSSLLSGFNQYLGQSNRNAPAAEVSNVKEVQRPYPQAASPTRGGRDRSQSSPGPYSSQAPIGSNTANYHAYENQHVHQGNHAAYSGQSYASSNFNNFGPPQSTHRESPGLLASDMHNRRETPQSSYMAAAPHAAPFLSGRDGLSPSRSQPNIAPSRIPAIPAQGRPGQAIEGRGIIGSTNQS